MKFDNFNTARCRVCGTIKQYQPGVDYQPEDFNCACTESKPAKETKLPRQKETLDGNSGAITKKNK